jgi:hypothetical protein
MSWGGEVEIPYIDLVVGGAFVIGQKIVSCMCHGDYKTGFGLILSRQLVNTATSSPADDVRHYVIPSLLLTNRFYFQQTSGIHAPVGKRKGCSLSGRSPASIADSFNIATMARKQRVKFTRN